MKTFALWLIVLALGLLLLNSAPPVTAGAARASAAPVRRTTRTTITLHPYVPYVPSYSPRASTPSSSRASRSGGNSRTDLEEVFSSDSPVTAQVLAGFDEGGFHGAMQAYRTYRASLPAPHLYTFLRPDKNAVADADKTLTDGLVVDNNPAFPLQRPVDWGADPYHDTRFGFVLNDFEWVYPLASAYESTGNPTYLVFPVEMTLDWEEQNVTRRITNSNAWEDMAVGLRAAVIAYLVDAAARSPKISDGSLWGLINAAVVHAQHLSDPATFRPYNHGLYQMLGLLALAQTLPELARFPDYGRYATAKAEGVLRESFAPDGVHLEHSPQYWGMVMDTLEWCMEQGLLDTEAMRALDTQSQRAYKWMIEPTGQLVNFGDTDFGNPFLPSDWPRRDPELQWALTRGASGSPPAPTSFVSLQGGYVVFRSSWTPAKGTWGDGSYLAFAAADHSVVHKHADDMTFSWSELGHPLIVDTGGPYRYDESEGRKYVLSTRAHNTVEIDQEDFPIPTNIAPRLGSEITRVATDGPARAVEARMTHSSSAVDFQRTLIYLPGRWVLLVDELTSPLDHDYIQWLHFDPSLEVRAAGSAFAAPIPGRSRSLYVVPLLPATDNEPVLVQGQSHPRLQGFVSYQYEKLTPNWTLGLAAQAKSLTYMTLLALGKEAPAILDASHLVVTPERIAAGWIQDGQPTEVEVSRAGGALQVAVTH